MPQNNESYEGLAKSLLIFSEEGYHELMLDSYNWANMVQLNHFTSSTCLFIGLSMTDPNLRRLLEVAAKKDKDNPCRHYAIMRRMAIKSVSGTTIDKFEQMNDRLQERLFEELGVNIIWIDDYKEIPKLLNKIRKGRD